MDAPPGVACMDTRHPRRLLAPEQVLIWFSIIYDRPSVRYWSKWIYLVPWLRREWSKNKMSKTTHNEGLSPAKKAVLASVAPIALALLIALLSLVVLQAPS